MSWLSSWVGKNKGVKSALAGAASAIPFVGGAVSAGISGMKDKSSGKGKKANSTVTVRVK
jgi:hypothetical protein